MNTNGIVLAQVGCGYWGPNLLRNFSALPDCRVKYVVDPSPERRAFVETNFPRTKAIEAYAAVLSDPEVTGVVISTPADTHYRLAREALLAGKHVFVEKPLATTVAEVDELGRLAAARKLVVMAGHTFIYNAAVRYVKKLLDAGELGDVRYIYSQRLNLGRIRSDIDALWNFAPHDISIIQYWLGNPRGDGLHAGPDRRRRFSQRDLSRQDHGQHPRQLARSPEGPQDDRRRLPQDGRV
jgi:predicted dehydrogenase